MSNERLTLSLRIDEEQDFEKLRALAKYAAQPAEDSLVLQDHQQPVRYRNIWIRRVGTYDK